MQKKKKCERNYKMHEKRNKKWNAGVQAVIWGVQELKDWDWASKRLKCVVGLKKQNELVFFFFVLVWWLWLFGFEMWWFVRFWIVIYEIMCWIEAWFLLLVLWFCSSLNFWPFEFCNWLQVLGVENWQFVCFLEKLLGFWFWLFLCVYVCVGLDRLCCNGANFYFWCVDLFVNWPFVSICMFHLCRLWELIVLCVFGCDEFFGSLCVSGWKLFLCLWILCFLVYFPVIPL